jgi:Ca2+-binding RTX toxin-like protein
MTQQFSVISLFTLLLLTIFSGVLSSSLLQTITVTAAFAQETSDETCLAQPATIVGTPGDDNLVGTEGRDVIAGLQGNDEIRGLGGDDLICTDEGNDRMGGGDGDDSMEGGPGNDRMFGELGNDDMLGGAGTDTMDGAFQILSKLKEVTLSTALTV